MYSTSTCIPTATLILVMSLLSVQAAPMDPPSSPDDNDHPIPVAREPGCPGLVQVRVSYGHEKVAQIGHVGRADLTLPIEERFRSCVYRLEYDDKVEGRIPALLKLSQYPMKKREGPRAEHGYPDEEGVEQEIAALKEMGLFLEERKAPGPYFHGSIIMKLQVPLNRYGWSSTSGHTWSTVIGSWSDIEARIIDEQKGTYKYLLWKKIMEESVKAFKKTALNSLGRYGIWNDASTKLDDVLFMVDFFQGELFGIKVAFINWSKWSRSLPEDWQAEDLAPTDLYSLQQWRDKWVDPRPGKGPRGPVMADLYGGPLFGVFWSMFVSYK